MMQRTAPANPTSENAPETARTLMAQRRFADARRLVTDALHAAPTDPALQVCLGEIHAAAGDAVAAETILRRVLESHPDYGPAWYQLALVLSASGRTADAESALARAADHAESREQALNRLGYLLGNKGRLDESARAYQRVLAAQPHHLTAWSNLIQVLLQANRMEAVHEEIARARHSGLDPALVELTEALSFPMVYRNRDDMLQWRRRSLAKLAALQGTGLRIRMDRLEFVPPHFGFAYHGLDDRAVMVQLAGIFRQSCPELAFRAPHIDAWRGPQERIHLGIYSANLRSHTVGKLNFGLVRYIDRKRFRITLFVPPHPGDKFAAQFRAAAEQTIELPRDLGAIRAAIAGQRLDALLFPDIGMDRLTGFVAHARLAPLQMTSWGHPVTTGIPSVDEFLSGELLEPAGGESNYSEVLVRFAHLPACYQRYNLPPLKTADSLGLPRARHLYFCPQSLFKLHPDFDQSLREILDRDGLAEVLCLDGQDLSWNAALRERLRANLGGLAARITFLPRMELTDFLSVLKATDVVLDTHHFGGGNTHYDALMVGAPVVTWPGEFMRGRVGSGCYRQLGVTDLIATDRAHYVDLALRTAADADFRAGVRESILARGDALFHDVAWLRAFEGHVSARLEARTRDAAKN